MWASIQCERCPQLSQRSNANPTTQWQQGHLCPNVGIEPALQPLSGESFHKRSSNTENWARLDIRAQDLWDKSKTSALFDVRVFHSHAPSNCTSSTEACYRRHEQEKRCACEKCIIEVEPSPSWSYLQVEAVDHLPQLSSRGLQASYLRSMDNCTAAPSPSSDVGSPPA